MSRDKRNSPSKRKTQGSLWAESAQRALELFQQGKFYESEKLFLKALDGDPGNSDVLHLLGLIAYNLREFEKALSYLRRAERGGSASPFICNSLGVVLKETGRVDDALQAYRRAIELKPDYAEAHNNLGNALKDLGMFDEAIEEYVRSLGIKPNDAETLNNMGNMLRETGRLNDAINAYRKALAINPGFVQVYRNLGNALKGQGRFADAIEAYRRAIGLKPDYAEAHNNLGNALKDLGMIDEAIREYERSIALKPDYGDPYNNLGNVYKERGVAEKAIELYLQSLRLKPDFAEVHNNLGNALKDRGDVAGAVVSYQKALALKPGLREAHSNLVYAKHFLSGTTLREIMEDHLNWNARYVAPVRGRRFVHEGRRSTYREEGLNLGFVSGDFRRHPVAYFIIRILEALSKKDCKIFCYGSQTENDEMTERFKAAAHVWRGCYHLSDDELADSIHTDGIDVLFDLTGHNERNRLMVFARKPAPVQITWAGYMATTGVETIDYIIADPYEIPEGQEEYYTEKVLRMPHSFVCYDPPGYAPPVRSLPALTNGYVTFGCFNILCKISPEIVRLWSALLLQIPGSRLMLKTRELNSGVNREHYMKLFVDQGIGVERIDLVGGTPHDEHLSYYNRIDIALDPFPFSGSTTTLESLWMGVPVITMPGETFASRHSLSFLSTVGLTETIASNRDHYIATAKNLAADIPRLEKIRLSLRDQFRASPLCDGEGFAERLLQELRSITTSSTTS